MDGEGLIHETHVRVRYPEVDRMGMVWHGHYLVFFEEGRTELMRSLGATYRETEEEGTLLVVIETGVTYHRPGRYDDELVVRTRLVSARGVRLRFEYDVLRGRHRLASGFTVLAACDAKGRPKRLPERLAALVAAGGSAGQERKAEGSVAVQGVGSARPGEAPAPGADRGES